MNTGPISTRYSKALLAYADENGSARQVATQIKAMLDNPAELPSPLDPVLEHFVAFLAEKGRQDYLKPVFRKYLELYCKEAGIKYARMSVVCDSPSLNDRIQALLEGQTGSKVILDTVVDPSLIGGFVLEVGGYMLDASVRHQIDEIRRQFIVSNNRII